MADLEAQHGAAGTSGRVAQSRTSVSTSTTSNQSRNSVSSSTTPNHSIVPTAYPNSCQGSDNDEAEQVGLYDLAENLRNHDPPVEPWFLEMTRLRRIYIMWLNKRLALCRKSLLGHRKASDEDMKELGEVLHLQGKVIEPFLKPNDY
jgi:hypothetical protein